MKPVQRRWQAKTVSARTLRALARAGYGLVEYPADIARPKTRGECAGGERPCPFTSCKYHLYLDVHPDRGSLKFNYPTLEPWEMKETCVLDIADRGGLTLEEVGALLSVTRERIRQIEAAFLNQLRRDPLILRLAGDYGYPKAA
jgi:hypothetical protein